MREVVIVAIAVAVFGIMVAGLLVLLSAVMKKL
jgi:hypothetical protein